MTAVAPAGNGRRVAARLPAFPWGDIAQDASDLAAAVTGGGVTAVAVMEMALGRAAEAEHLGAFWQLDPEAVATAESVDAQVAAGEGPALAGVPLAVKDCFDVAGLVTTGGLAGPGRTAQTDAEAVRRLRRVGCVPVGKAAMDSLGWTTSGQADGFPRCHNPLDATLTPGGSSAGPAVAVAAGIAAVGLGSDTVGSVRIPASYCGLVGFRPTAHTISSRGVVQANRRFDVPGLIARSVRDCEAAYAAVGVGSTLDSPACEGPLEVALLEDLLEEADADVAAALERAAEALQECGVTVRRTRLNWRPRGVGRLLAADLARSWGQRIEREPDLFTESLRESAEFGRSASTLKLQLTLRDLRTSRKRLASRFAAVAAVLCPTTPSRVPQLEDESTARSTHFTRIFSALAWPSLTLPVWTDGVATPAGVHLAAPGVNARGVLRVGRMLERALEP